MIYTFTIRETKKVDIPVRANTPDEAQKIFTQWYQKHSAGEPKDTTIYDLLDNGYEGRDITRSPGIPESDWGSDKVMLPEEGSKPEEPLYNLQVRFADGSELATYKDQTLGSIGTILSSLSDKYYLFPDTSDYDPITGPGYNEPCGYRVNPFFNVYAVLKDEEETWYDFNEGGLIR